MQERKKVLPELYKKRKRERKSKNEREKECNHNQNHQIFRKKISKSIFPPRIFPSRIFGNDEITARDLCHVFFSLTNQKYRLWITDGSFFLPEQNFSHFFFRFLLRSPSLIKCTSLHIFYKWNWNALTPDTGCAWGRERGRKKAKEKEERLAKKMRLHICRRTRMKIRRKKKKSWAKIDKNSGWIFCFVSHCR